MTLREFVSDTLSQIVSGVADSRKKNPQIAPPVSTGNRESGSYYVVRGGVANPAAFIVEFDVAVTLAKKTSIDAGGGISVHVFEAGAKRKASEEHSTVSRIKFGVPVTYDRMA